MANTHEAVVEFLQKNDGYRIQFEKVFGDGPVNIDQAAQAIASFERAIVTGASPYDFYEPLRAFRESLGELLEDEEAFEEDFPDLFDDYTALQEAAEANPMSESAQRGRDLFFGKAECTACHSGANFTDELYHNLGVGMDVDKPDLGRFEVNRRRRRPRGLQDAHAPQRRLYRALHARRNSKDARGSRGVVRPGRPPQSASERQDQEAQSQRSREGGRGGVYESAHRSIS